MTSYPRKPFIKQSVEGRQSHEAEQGRQKQLKEVYNRRAIIMGIMKRMRGK
jgi:hypothetical protein